MDGPYHYREGERLLALANAEYMDESNAAGPRRDYADDAAWDRALQIGRESREQGMRTAALLTSMAQAHFTAAQAAATALNDSDGGMPVRDWNAWYAAAGTPEDGDAPGQVEPEPAGVRVIEIPLGAMVTHPEWNDGLPVQVLGVESTAIAITQTAPTGAPTLARMIAVRYTFPGARGSELTAVVPADTRVTPYGGA